MLGPSWSPRTKAALACVLALLLFAPMGISERNQPVVTGHSTFYNGAGFDPCLASIAGIMRTQVLWFNDQILAERYGGVGTYVYVTENGSQDPRPNVDGIAYLFTEGVFYDFVDPNGVHWHVDELFYSDLHTDVGVHPNEPVGGLVETPRADDNRTYVWVVELSAFPIHDQFAGDPRSPNFHDLYNFLLIVDTCKFHRSSQTNWNYANANDFNITHQGQDLQPGFGHEAGTDVHRHESFTANLWVGTKPIIVPIGANPSGAQWNSEWATTQAQGDASNAYPGKPKPPTVPDPTGAP